MFLSSGPRLHKGRVDKVAGALACPLLDSTTLCRAVAPHPWAPAVPQPHLALRAPCGRWLWQMCWDIANWLPTCPEVPRPFPGNSNVERWVARVTIGSCEDPLSFVSLEICVLSRFCRWWEVPLG